MTKDGIIEHPTEMTGVQLRGLASPDFVCESGDDKLGAYLHNRFLHSFRDQYKEWREMYIAEYGDKYNHFPEIA